MLEPAFANSFQTSHADLLFSSFKQRLGFPLLEDNNAKALYHASFPVLSHTIDPDPILTYGNLAAQNLFELPWHDLIKTPSRLTAEPALRGDREAMFVQMREQGWIDNYEGIRVSSTGKRFQLRRAIIWTVTDAAGRRVGEAAALKEITPL